MTATILPLVSVIMPAYNRADVISRALNSLLIQTCPLWECIVIDDGSTDNTSEIAIRYQNKDKRIKYIKNNGEKGAAGARNTGIKIAKGAYISFLDTDDEFLPTTIESQITEFKTNTHIGFLYSDIIFKDSTGKIIPHDLHLGIHGQVYPQVLAKGFLSPGLVISVKKECLYHVGFWDKTLPASQDDDLCFKLAKNYSVGFITKALAIAHGSNDQISSNSLKVAMGWWMLWNKYETDVLEYCGKDTMAKHYKECLHHFLHANNVKMSWNAYRKFSHFGGSLSKRKKIWFILYLLSYGRIHYITKKNQNKL